MNTVLIVLPILTALMYELGLTLKLDDFKMLARSPRAVWAGLTGQLVVLPLLAFGLGLAFDLPPVYFIGLMLIACSPGGSSSNVFSMLARGDVALSVSLTAASSIITLFTIPVVMELTVGYVSHAGADVHLPVGSLIVQNLLLMLLPIVAGVLTRRYWPNAAERVHQVLSRVAFPALMLLAAIFFLQYYEEILHEFPTLGGCITMLILLAMGAGWLISKVCRLGLRQQRTLLIEVGMQNAAQAIALASSPFVFADNIMAIPAIIYALMMNVVLLTYVAVVKRRAVAMA